ncbi:hypothetical protein [Branchiibius sp. NY16-3462-2]|uniref:hypothetical protein n=1 Tax=Branchiibius sp. NY16-3462-2 TaxID=1807500 RepID=UPI00079425E2|nr:hypothetical protein [Branchiibius sp. NY16-3462-2]KYH45567.1 hypothetical protein AZH51_16005 [Branchiibius sp. NY16-3462-2]
MPPFGMNQDGKSHEAAVAQYVHELDQLEAAGEPVGGWGPTPAALLGPRTEFAGLVTTGRWTGWEVSVVLLQRAPGLLGRVGNRHGPDEAFGVEYWPAAPQRVDEQETSWIFESWREVENELAGQQITWYSPVHTFRLLTGPVPVVPPPSPQVVTTFPVADAPGPEVPAVRDRATRAALLRRAAVALIVGVFGVGVIAATTSFGVDDNGDTREGVPDLVVGAGIVGGFFAFAWAVLTAVLLVHAVTVLARHPWRQVGATLNEPQSAAFANGQPTLALNDGDTTWYLTVRALPWNRAPYAVPGLWFAGQSGGGGMVATPDRRRIAWVARSWTATRTRKAAHEVTAPR